MYALEAARYDSLDAKQLRTLGRPVARGSGTVLFTTEYHSRDTLLDVTHCRIVNRHLFARWLIRCEATFDASTITKLRADFLLLLKNAEKVKNYAQAQTFATAVRTYRTYVEDVLRSLTRTLENEGESAWAKKLLKDTWGLVSGLRVPIGEHGSTSQRKYDPDETPESYFAAYQGKAKKWAEKLKREARTAWASLEDYVTHTTGGAKTFKRSTDEQIEIEGITIILRGFGMHDAAHDQDQLNRFRAELKHYARRAKRVLPLLLTKKLPIVLDFNCGLDAGGHYERDRIFVCFTNTIALAHIVAHEMGHHLWRSFLSEDAQTFWTAAIRADYGTLDLQDLLDAWPSQYKDSTLGFFDNKELALSDPTLYLQANIYFFPPIERQEPKYRTKDELAAGIQQLKAEGLPTTIVVPKNPITAYATKNPEEAFCEALGLLVAYGPRTVPATTRGWLQMILPALHIENRTALASSILEAHRLL